MVFPDTTGKSTRKKKGYSVLPTKAIPTNKTNQQGLAREKCEAGKNAMVAQRKT